MREAVPAPLAIAPSGHGLPFRFNCAFRSALERQRMLSRPKKPAKIPEEEPRVQVWFVSFADLMGLTVSFFVMMLSFSTQDLHKLQVLAESMRGAFGIQWVAHQPADISALPMLDRTSSDWTPHVIDPGPNSPAPSLPVKSEREFAMAAAALRQALREMPEIAAMSDNIILRETAHSFALEIVDHSSHPMFRQGAAIPFDWARLLIQKLAAPLKATALRISIVGHASLGETTRGDVDVFELSMRRADMARRLLKRDGLPSSQLFVVSGKGDAEPLLPEEPTAAANRRVTIALMYDNEALPPELRP